MNTKKSRRYLSFVLMVALMVILLAGCGGTGDGQEGSGQVGNDGNETGWPQKGVTITCCYSAGGGTDLLCRSMIPGLKDIWGQAVTVVNKTGAGGAVGYAAAASDAGDGYSIVNATVEIVLYPLTMPDLQYKTEDFKPICNFNTDYGTITVPIDAPYDTLDEFITYCKAHPGEVTIGNSGVGGVWHFIAANFAKQAGIELNHIPFDGGAAAVTALAGGHLDVVPMGTSEIDAQIQAGTVKVLCSLSPERNPYLPEVPTAAELGYEGHCLGVWRGLAVPSQTPDDVCDQIEAACEKVFEGQQVQETLSSLKFNLDFLDRQEFAQRWEDERTIYADLAAELGL